MAEITSSINENRKAGGRKRKTHNLKIDMTPMVDLGFLLISFFVITTEMTKPTVMDLAMPKDGPPTPLGESGALTVLVAGDKTIYYYEGDWDAAVKTNQVTRSNFAIKEGIREVIRTRQKQLDMTNAKDGRDALMLIIKPTDEAVYEDVIDMLDEALIHNIKRYTVVKPSEAEAIYLHSHDIK